MNADDLNLRPEDLAELSAAWRAVEHEDPEAVLRAQRRALQLDPVLAWRSALAAACTEERVTYMWAVEEAVTIVSVQGCHQVRVPDWALDKLMEHRASPRAVACQLRAVCIDPRFASWGAEEEE